VGTHGTGHTVMYLHCREAGNTYKPLTVGFTSPLWPLPQSVISGSALSGPLPITTILSGGAW
jgi:hypothetical protein